MSYPRLEHLGRLWRDCGATSHESSLAYTLTSGKYIHTSRFVGNMAQEKWQEALEGLGTVQLRWVIAYLLGRSNITDEQFIARVKELTE